jgi:molybdopterin synthase sulfur carrier subunit
MRVRVRYFASLREAVRIDVEDIDVPPEVATAGALRIWLSERGGVWAEHMAPGRAVRTAVAHRIATADTPIAAGQEVAFFPPVTGG